MKKRQANEDSLNNPKVIERLVLLCEANALPYLIEQAGGKASDGEHRTLHLQPQSLHQRTPFFIGSSCMVEKAGLFVRMPETQITAFDH